ncbi:hypothetical protein B0H10DRAFT_1970484 [Mycena sp. CBHHK59/15]|nr:hypothetical protein B0H10DRAFT_1970484 [Mycena sp. CBHHK59/15]
MVRHTMVYQGINPRFWIGPQHVYPSHTNLSGLTYDMEAEGGGADNTRVCPLVYLLAAGHIVKSCGHPCLRITGGNTNYCSHSLFGYTHGVGNVRHHVHRVTQDSAASPANCPVPPSSGGKRREDRWPSAASNAHSDPTHANWCGNTDWSEVHLCSSLVELLAQTRRAQGGVAAWPGLAAASGVCMTSMYAGAARVGIKALHTQGAALDGHLKAVRCLGDDCGSSVVEADTSKKEMTQLGPKGPVCQEHVPHFILKHQSHPAMLAHANPRVSTLWPGRAHKCSAALVHRDESKVVEERVRGRVAGVWGWTQIPGGGQAGKWWTSRWTVDKQTGSGQVDAAPRSPHSICEQCGKFSGAKDV